MDTWYLFLNSKSASEEYPSYETALAAFDIYIQQGYNMSEAVMVSPKDEYPAMDPWDEYFAEQEFSTYLIVSRAEE